MRNLGILLVILISCHTSNIPKNSKFEIKSYGFKNGDTLVDIGTGDGYHAALISNLYPLSYFILEDIDSTALFKIPIDYSKNFKFSKNIINKYSVVLGTSEAIPLRDSSFKLVLCRKTLHEFINPPKMLVEIERILTEKGRLIIVEGIPIKEGEIDKFCRKPLLSKDSIVNFITLNGKFKLLESTIVPSSGNREFIVLIFEKSRG